MSGEATLGAKMIYLIKRKPTTALHQTRSHLPDLPNCISPIRQAGTGIERLFSRMGWSNGSTLIVPSCFGEAPR